MHTDTSHILILIMRTNIYLHTAGCQRRLYIYKNMAVQTVPMHKQ